MAQQGTAWRERYRSSWSRVRLDRNLGLEYYRHCKLYHITHEMMHASGDVKVFVSAVQHGTMEKTANNGKTIKGMETSHEETRKRPLLGIEDAVYTSHLSTQLKG